MGITVGVFALIVVLSVFNGFEDVVISLYNSFDSDIKIQADSGKYFYPDPEKISKFKEIEGIKSISEVLEENALIKFRKNQTIATLKGINKDYLETTGLDSMVVVGEAVISYDSINYAIIGSGIAGKLGIVIFDNTTSLQIFYPKKGSSDKYYLNPEDAFNRKNIILSSIFSIQQEFDAKYIIVPLEFIRPLVSESLAVTSLEANIFDNADLKAIKKTVKKIFGAGFIVKDRYEQHDWLYKIMRSEKLMVFLILSLILIIAAFNLIGSLLMLSLEKKKDMMVLKSMGAQPGLIRKIFFFEGLLLSISSAVLGIGLGTIVCWLQMKFQLIKIASSGGTFVLEAYPVSFKATDFLWVFLIVIVLGLISSLLPARTAYKTLSIRDLHK